MPRRSPRKGGIAVGQAIRWGLVIAVYGLGAERACAQAPTLPHLATEPGTTSSMLGPAPGAGASPLGDSPGIGGNVLGARLGPSVPRVPTTITTPGAAAMAPRARPVIVAPARLPILNPPVYGTLEVPAGVEAEDSPEGLTLDSAIERLVHYNAELLGSSFEIPQAQADILTAGLRANPIFYADSQLIPYGSFNRTTAGGPTQYDVNISHPVDFSGKRRARVVVAERAKAVLEAQYQDAVRLQIDNLYSAYIDVLAARETVRFARAGVAGLGRVVEVTKALYQRSDTTRPELLRVEILREAAAAGLLQAEETERRAKRTLGPLLNLAPAEAEALHLRAAIADTAPLPPSTEALIVAAMEARPDLQAFRLGIARAEGDVRSARANRFADAYVLYQPFTFQNNAPFGEKSATSWALGVTCAVPLYNRNQGTIQRARLNVSQTQVEMAALEQRVVEEVIRAEREYELSRTVLHQVQSKLLPEARRYRNDSLTLFTTGEKDALYFLEAQRFYNEVVRQYRDALVRHRRSMLALNTAVGVRILP